MTTPNPPGWYDDPNDYNAQRYWDGQDWTPQRQRKPPPPSVTPTPPPPPTLLAPPARPPSSNQDPAGQPGQMYSDGQQWRTHNAAQTPPAAAPQGPGWWQASDLKWYPPERNSDYVAPLPPPGLTPPPGPTPTSQIGTPPNDVLSKLRTNQLALHLIGGALGGAVGALLAEIASRDSFESRFESVVYTGLWFSICTSVIAAALFVCGEWYQRRQLLPGRVLKVLLFGAIAGFISGAVAQAVYLIHIGSPEFQNYVLRSFCWGLAGAIIGGLLSRTVPNLGLIRGSAAGFIGGCVGGILFVLVSNEVPETWGRIVGVGSLGLALGLAMYLVENLFREASLEVIWAYNETTRVSLGAQPISVGGSSEDQIFVRGLPPRASTIVLQNGQIEHFDYSNGTRTPLTDGSQLSIGSVHLVIHAAN